MSIRARVGRHRREGGRECQNWADDQNVVIALLNFVTVKDGGAGHSIPHKVVAGVASDELYNAIVRFEDKHFPGQQSGYVDPGGKLFQQMLRLQEPDQKPPPKPPAKVALDTLRGNVLDESQSKGWTAGDRVHFDQVVKMAVRYIDRLREGGLVATRHPAEMFGRAHVTDKIAFYWTGGFGGLGKKLRFIGKTKEEDYDEEAPELPLERYGAPIDINATVVTEKFGALVLFKDGECLRVPPYNQTSTLSRCLELLNLHFTPQYVLSAYRESRGE